MIRDELRQVSVEFRAADRRDLVEELWRSLERDPEPILEWQRKLLDERLEALEADPKGEPWEVVERRVWAGEE